MTLRDIEFFRRIAVEAARLGCEPVVIDHSAPLCDVCDSLQILELVLCAEQLAESQAIEGFPLISNLADLYAYYLRCCSGRAVVESPTSFLIS